MVSIIRAAVRYSLFAVGLTLPVYAPAADTIEGDYEAGLSGIQIEGLQNGTALGAAEVQRARPINSATLKLIMDFESWVDHAYDDPSGYCTIGYGHLIGLKSCTNIDLKRLGFDTQISKETGMGLLYQDTIAARVAVSRLLATQGDQEWSQPVALSDDQFGALVSFTFNVGEGNLYRSKLRTDLIAGRPHLARRDLGHFISSKGKILAGLKRRRACEADLFESQFKVKADGSVDTQHCNNNFGAAADDVIADIDIR